MADKKHIAIAVLVVGVIGAAAVFAYPGLIKGSSISPNYNGLQFAFFGFQPAGSSTVYVANNNNPCPSTPNQCGFVKNIPANGPVTGSYSWSYPNTVTVSGSVVSSWAGCPGILLTCSNTESVTTNVYNPNNNPVTGSPSIAKLFWSVPYNGVFIHASGSLYTQNVQVTFQPQTGSSGPVFSNVVLWMVAYDQNYDRYLPVSSAGQTLPNGTVLGTFAAPVFIQQTGGSITPTSAQNVATTPGYTVANQQVLSYTTPQVTSNFASLLNSVSSTSLLNKTLSGAGNLAPDSQMYQYTFFPITLNSLGPYGCSPVLGINTQTCYPSLTLNFMVYVLQIGQYLFYNPSTQSISTTTYNPTGNNPFAWFTSPWGIITSFVVVGVVVLVTVAAIIIARKVP